VDARVGRNNRGLSLIIKNIEPGPFNSLRFIAQMFLLHGS